MALQTRLSKSRMITMMMKMCQQSINHSALQIKLNIKYYLVAASTDLL